MSTSFAYPAQVRTSQTIDLTVVNMQHLDDPIAISTLTQRCLGRPELVERVLSSFRKSAESDVEGMALAARTTNREDLLKRAHRLKGTSLTASAISLAEIAERIHATAQDSEAQQLIQLTDQLHEEYSAIVRWLDSRQAGT